MRILQAAKLQQTAFQEITCFQKPFSSFSQSYARFVKKISDFVEESTTLVLYQVYTGHELWNWTTFGILACQLPINIYLLYRIMDGQLEGSQLTVALLIISFQMALIFGTMVNLAMLLNALYGGSVELPVVQRLLFKKDKKTIQLKIKVMDMYERMHSDQRPDLSIGPFDCFTFKALFEVRLWASLKQKL